MYWGKNSATACNPITLSHNNNNINNNNNNNNNSLNVARQVITFVDGTNVIFRVIRYSGKFPQRNVKKLCYSPIIFILF
jgi:hypothetical protein